LRRFSGVTASLIFYVALFALFAWQVREHHAEEMAALAQPAALQQMDREAWWAGRWREVPEDRTRLASVSSRRFDAQVAVTPERITALLAADGWEAVPDSDWRWIVQALNPEPDQANLPLLGRAYQGRSEALLLRRNIEPEGRLLTFRLWDSGFRLMPGGQVLYVGQTAEEELVQRYGVFSYWSASPMRESLEQRVRASLGALQQKEVDGGLLLLREPPAAVSQPD
jgi:hypothetical protein